MASALLVVHAAFTWLFTGGLWFVWLVHYPLFRLVPNQTARALENEHYRRTMPLACSILAVEALLALILVIVRPPGIPFWQLLAGVGFLALGHYLTWARCVPGHQCLLRRFERPVLDELIRLHGYRVVIWSARALLAAWWLVSAN